MTYHRTATLTLTGAARPFHRTLTFRSDLTGDEVLDRLCLTLGRFPTPDALLRVGDTYWAREAYHFDHPDLSDTFITRPLPADLREMEFLLHRTDGWIFHVEFSDDADLPWLSQDDLPPVVVRDTTPLLPGPKLRLAEYNAVTLAHDNLPLPPDLERMIVVDALEGLMTPEVTDIETAMALYTTLREQGRQAELPRHLRFLTQVPDREILFDLLDMAVSDRPPRVTKAGYLPVAVVRALAEKFPALYPPQSTYRYSYAHRIGTAREATTLTSVLAVGEAAGLLVVEPGENLQATDFGRQLLDGGADTYPELQSRLLRAWITQPAPQIPAEPGGRRLTFQEYLERQPTVNRAIDEDAYGRVLARPRPPQPPVPEDLVPF
ncbi:hypothetical protein [Corynebacterium sp.]|uniref:hypothetical protein n=1 Tax=Corynebacterium sp. TaxID=1720 RepID=UPI0026E04549|nr:hypothetical protein [Corynebacterium sp.]MDO5511962.1 hypothetical protein [Corynebacterium sp.]